MRKALRIAINAQILPGRGTGGVESAVVGLVKALGKPSDSSDEYVIIGPWQDPDWLRPYVGTNQRIVSGPKPAESSLARALGPLLPVAMTSRGMLRRLLGIAAPAQPQVPVSDGFYEGLGCDVIHFPYQKFVVCALPSVYNPHDLQHLHYPQFFAPAIIAWRETVYPAGCHFARTVVVASQWVKQDIVEHYGVNPAKLQVIPWAPPTEAYAEPSVDEIAAVQRGYELQMPFALYPAMTWEHKNHIRLLEALASLRNRNGLRVNLVCTGHQEDFWNHIATRIDALDLREQVRFLGLVAPEELRALYRLARFVVIPSLFEAASGPLFEAWQEDTPVACSTVTSLPEQAGGAALLFDPLSVDSIGDAVARMATDDELLSDLLRRGRRRRQDFSWERTAKAYRAVYRRAAGFPLGEEDRWLLGWDWMREPQKSREDQR